MSDRTLAEDRTPICPFCGSTRHDSERLHDGNVMETADLVDAMLTVFLRDPDEVRPAGIWPDPFPSDYPPDAVRRFRAKMNAALGVAIRNMPYLAALRAQATANGRVEAMRVELHRLSLVIESAVRSADPDNHAAVMALLRSAAPDALPSKEAETC